MGSLLFISIIIVFALENCYSCSQVYTSQSGYIDSPKDASGHYPNNANCYYTIRGASNTHYIHLRFLKFGLENNLDFLYVGNQKFTGNQTGYANAYYFDNTITLRFTSDGSVNSAGGFLIKYSMIPDAFSKIFEGRIGIIESPKATNSSFYPDNAYYIYIIRSVFTDVHLIQITFETFSMEKNYDYLFIGSQSFTGNKTGYKTDYNTNNNLTLIFTSDGSAHSYAGFTIRYVITPGKDCRDGRYGQDCAVRCSSGCSDVCDKVTGRCSCRVGWTGTKCDTGCSQGYYGQDCGVRCGSGCSDVCDKVTGRCSCKFGWTGMKCDAACPSGTYDSYCTKVCSPGCVNGSCNKQDGRCSCKPGFTGVKCSSDCRDGRYGQGCGVQCNSGCSDVCDKVTGRCSCRIGLTGTKCDAECPSGTYDSYCTKVCSPGCVDGSCNKHTGSCSCQPGFTGANCSGCREGDYGHGCSLRCSSGCSNECDKVTGTCSCKFGWTGTKCDAECPSGTYDSYCTKLCSPGCVDRSCNKHNGSCSCRPGYTGANCRSECPPGKYDSYCTKVCSPKCENGSCNKEDGSCSHKPEYIGNSASTDNVKLIAGMTGGSAGFILLVIAVLCICCCIRKRTRKGETRGEEPIYDRPIEEEAWRREERYESMRYSADQKTGTSQSVSNVSGGVDNETEYVNIPKTRKTVGGRNDKKQQCYENHAIQVGDSVM